MFLRDSLWWKFFHNYSNFRWILGKLMKLFHSCFWLKKFRFSVLENCVRFEDENNIGVSGYSIHSLSLRFEIWICREKNHHIWNQKQFTMEKHNSEKKKNRFIDLNFYKLYICLEFVDKKYFQPKIVGNISVYTQRSYQKQRL